MARQTYIWDRAKKTWVPHDKYKRHRRSQGVMVISDVMDTVQSMADGKHYDSKSRIRAEYRARGCIELGNEMPQAPAYEPSSAAGDIVRTMKENGQW